MHGDCLERMKEIDSGSVDMVLADPPYGMTACKWDSIVPLEPMWEQLKRVVKKNGVVVMTASQPFTTKLISSNMNGFKHCWVWDKVAPTGYFNAKKKPLSRHEDICIFSESTLGNFTYNPQMRIGRLRNKSPKRSSDGVQGRCYGTIKHSGDNINDKYYPTDIYTLSTANKTGKIHPTQKPVALMEYLIRTYTNEGETALDFTMGSGTTGVACVKTKRDFIGIELDDNYFNVAKGRIGEGVM